MTPNKVIKQLIAILGLIALICGPLMALKIDTASGLFVTSLGLLCFIKDDIIDGIRDNI